MDSKTKRTRTANWDSSDKILLRQLIEENITIIENKNVDTNTSRMKKDAWREITNSFNNLSATMRETAQIQAQWRGTKMKAKAENWNYKKNLKATGGGPPPKSPDPEHNKLMALIPHEFEEDENEHDCDTEMVKENVFSQKRISTLNTLIIDDDFEDVVFLENETPKKYCPSPPPSVSYSPLKIYAPSPQSPSPPSPPTPSPLPLPLDTSSKKKSASFKRKMNSKDDELLKKEMFNSAMENRKTEKTFMQLEHNEKMKTILMERNEKLKTYQMERSEKEKMLQMDRRHKEEIHQLKIKRLEEEHFAF